MKQLHTKEEKLRAFGDFLDVLDTLRVKCPWDAKQTNESLRPNTIEEVFELADAIINCDIPNTRKELGDVLLHIAFYSRIAEEYGNFDIADVCDSLVEKLKFRHPHIYGDINVNNADEVAQNWEEIKLKERKGNKTVLGGVPSALPAMIKANRIQEKARNVGFDWEDRRQVWDKVKEEISEVEEEIENNDSQNRLEEEFGDLLFSVINAARLYGVDPENALEKTNIKFIKRFNHIEEKAKAMGKPIKELTLAEMDKIWNEAKNL
jgi:mazG family protein